jgi:hypothetical protein
MANTNGLATSLHARVKKGAGNAYWMKTPSGMRSEPNSAAEQALASG